MSKKWCDVVIGDDVNIYGYYYTAIYVDSKVVLLELNNLKDSDDDSREPLSYRLVSIQGMNDQTVEVGDK